MKIIPLHKNKTLLINKAKKNNRKAQHELYHLYAPKMLSVCRYYLKDSEQAEEAMLNGFLNVFTNIKAFEHKGSFEGWVRRIMVRACISYLRQKKVIEFVAEDYVLTGSVDSINSNIEVEYIQQLIDGLPEGYKLVFVMYAVEGYKHQEIAKLLDISEGTSKSQLFKARQWLKEQINKQNKRNNVTR